MSRGGRLPPRYTAAVKFRIRAITLDLDDTLWPFAPIGARIERVLDDWLRVHSPRTAERYPVQEMRALRDRIFTERTDLAHDMSALRRLCLHTAFVDSGEDPALVDAAYDVFYAERNRVECYPDAVDALARIAARLPVAALSNGNADLAAIGLDHHFAFQLGAREHGAAKPEASIFLAACDRLGCAPDEVLHVGDHVVMDVLGAARAGLRTAWVHREDARAHHPQWPHTEVVPDVIVPDLAALADLIERLPAPVAVAAGAPAHGTAP